MQNQLQTPPDLIIPEGMKLQPKKITKENLKEKFEEFKADNTNLDKVQAQGIEWFAPGFIIELFIGDFSELSLLADSDSYYKRATGIAKILSASSENTRLTNYDGSPILAYQKVKPGDIVFLGDDLMNLSVNPAWQNWYDSNGRGVMKGQEPLKHVRKYHRWIEMGMLYLIDRDEEIIEKEGLEISLATLHELKVPMVFRVPVQDVLLKIENPFN